MASSFATFDLNVPVVEDDNGNATFDLNEPVLEDVNDNGKFPSAYDMIWWDSISTAYDFISSFTFLTGIDLNLPLDEYGAVNFDFLENIAGKNFLLQQAFHILGSLLFFNVFFYN